MRRSIFTCLLVLAFSVSGFSQTSKQEKKLQKAQALIEKDEISKALKTLEDLTTDAPSYAEAWDELSKLRMGIYFYRLSDSKDLSNVSFTVKKGDDSSEVKLEQNDSLMMAIQLMLEEFKPSKMAYRSMINTMRNATLNCNNAESSSMLLRNFLVDPKVDTAVNDAAKEMFNQAEKQFQSNNFGKAAELYQKAIDIQPNYFKASLYLGDSYYAMKNYREAINYFKRSVESFPTMLEPRKYLSDAYNGEGLYKKAIEEGIDALCIYPDQNMYLKVRDLFARHENKLLPRQLVRIVYPISKETSSGKIPGELTDEEQSRFLKKQADYWEYYSAAGKNLKDKFDNKGINSSNNGERYLELACWEEMLKYSQAPELETARKMKALDMLDCYVFITCFHHDIYNQYHDFASLNKEKIKNYFEKASTPR